MEESSDASRRDAGTPCIEEKRAWILCAIFVDEGWACFGQIPPDEVDRRRRDRDFAFLFSLAQNSDPAFDKIDVTQVDRNEFADAQSARIHEFKRREVPEGECRGVGGNFEENVDLIDGVCGAQLFWDFGRLEVFKRAFFEQVLPDEVMDKRSDGRDFTRSGGRRLLAEIFADPFSHALSCQRFCGDVRFATVFKVADELADVPGIGGHGACGISFEFERLDEAVDMVFENDGHELGSPFVPWGTGSRLLVGVTKKGGI